MKDFRGTRSEAKIIKANQDLLKDNINDVYVYSEADAEELDEFNMQDHDSGIRVRTLESNLLRRSEAKGNFRDHREFFMT